MVVEEDPQRCRELCDVLTSHGLSVRTTHPTDLAMEVQGWPGVILVGNGHDTSRGWELAQRIRTFNHDVPIILFGNGHADPPTRHPALVQAALPPSTSQDTLVKEVERWLAAIPAHSARQFPGIVLLVEDDAKLRTIVKEFLELNGFAVLAVASGEEALETLAGVTPRVVLLDIKMPGMDGLTVLRHMRVAHPNLPVIFITHVDEEEVMEEAVILGANDYLIKPFNFEHLKHVLLLKIFT
ncbi:MAG: response regulator [Candidatus Omnitrophica bacterium]|nr:response regulator [Candidatus Omnitrophota bacterium]